MAPRSKDFGRATVFSVLSVFTTEAAAEAYRGFLVGALLPVCAPAVAATRTIHVKTCFQSIGILKLNFIKLESLCPFLITVQQSFYSAVCSVSMRPELTVACKTVLLHY
jgi:hypothetical protein